MDPRITEYSTPAADTAKRISPVESAQTYCWYCGLRDTDGKHPPVSVRFLAPAPPSGSFECSSPLE